MFALIFILFYKFFVVKGIFIKMFYMFCFKCVFNENFYMFCCKRGFHWKYLHVFCFLVQTSVIFVFSFVYNFVVKSTAFLLLQIKDGVLYYSCDMCLESMQTLNDEEVSTCAGLQNSNDIVQGFRTVMILCRASEQ